ncbi:MAG: TAXI family TRAP transporter solute-binding subunit [Candidatus Hodarchaeota archaeon]
MKLRLRGKFLGFICISVLISVLLCFTAGEAKAAKFIRIKSSSLGGTWYAGGAAWAKLITENYPEYVGVNIGSPGLDNESIKRLARKETELAFLTNYGSYIAYKGMPPTWKKPQSHLRALFSIWTGVINAVVMADSKFKGLQDLQGASIATYVVGDITGEQCLELLRYHGVTEKNAKIYRIMKADASRMFIDKRIDCFMYLFAKGHPNLKEVSAARKIRFLRFDPEITKVFMKENPYYFIGDFGEEFGAPNEKQLFCPMLTACHVDAPEDMIYKVVKVWFENIDWLRTVLPSAIPQINLKNPRAGIPIPFHPGAEKYLKEAGLIK